MHIEYIKKLSEQYYSIHKTKKSILCVYQNDRAGVVNLTMLPHNEVEVKNKSNIITYVHIIILMNA